MFSELGIFNAAPDVEVASRVVALPIELEDFEEFALNVPARLSPVKDLTLDADEDCRNSVVYKASYLMIQLAIIRWETATKESYAHPKKELSSTILLCC